MSAPDYTTALKKKTTFPCFNEKERFHFVSKAAAGERITICRQQRCMRRWEAKVSRKQRRLFFKNEKEGKYGLLSRLSTKYRDALI